MYKVELVDTRNDEVRARKEFFSIEQVKEYIEELVKHEHERVDIFDGIKPIRIE